MVLNSIGQNMKRVRLEKKLRQEDVAEKAEISLTYYGAVERGEKIPSLETFISILNALQVSADVLLCDVVDQGYVVKHSLMTEKLDRLSKPGTDMIDEVIDTIIKHLS